MCIQTVDRAVPSQSLSSPYTHLICLAVAVGCELSHRCRLSSASSGGWLELRNKRGDDWYSHHLKSPLLPRYRFDVRQVVDVRIDLLSDGARYL